MTAWFTFCTLIAFTLPIADPVLIKSPTCGVLKRLSKYSTASTFACITLFPSSSLIAGPDDPKGKIPFG